MAWTCESIDELLLSCFAGRVHAFPVRTTPCEDALIKPTNLPQCLHSTTLFSITCRPVLISCTAPEAPMDDFGQTALPAQHDITAAPVQCGPSSEPGELYGQQASHGAITRSESSSESSNRSWMVTTLGTAEDQPAQPQAFLASQDNESHANQATTRPQLAINESLNGAAQTIADVSMRDPTEAASQPGLHSLVSPISTGRSQDIASHALAAAAGGKGLVQKAQGKCYVLTFATASMDRSVCFWQVIQRASGHIDWRHAEVRQLDYSG